MNAWITGIVIICFWGIVQFLVLPYARTELKRRESREHVPQPQEIWMQDGDTLLYIDSVGPNGVSIIHYDGQKIEQWTDSWAEWKQRLDVKILWFTGQKRPLGTEAIR